jgi:hypothetical protein
MIDKIKAEIEKRKHPEEQGDLLLCLKWAEKLEEDLKGEFKNYKQAKTIQFLIEKQFNGGGA